MSNQVISSEIHMPRTKWCFEDLMRRQIFGLNTTKKHLLYWGGPPFPFLIKVPRKITTFVRLYVNCSMDFIITISQKYYVIKFEIENFKIFFNPGYKKKKKHMSMSNVKRKSSNVKCVWSNQKPLWDLSRSSEISVDLVKSQ